MRRYEAAAMFISVWYLLVMASIMNHGVVRMSETGVDGHTSIVSNANVTAGPETLPPKGLGATDSLFLGKVI